MNFTDGQFFTVESISPRMEKTPEGFLLCKSVPISRIGVFDYSPQETGLTPGADGIVHIERTESELFDEQTIRSFEGKDVVFGHSSFVDPRNWKSRSVGTVQNVRRGEGDDADKLVADLLIKDERAIESVESWRLREVSCGYDANVEEVEGGRVRQVGIVGNHVALVPKGRCGNACKIRDGAMTTNLKTMLRRLFKDGDEEKFNEKLDEIEVKEIGDEDGTDPITPKTDSEKSLDERIAVLEHEYGEMGQKIDAMRQMMEKLMPKKSTGDEDPESDPKYEDSEETFDADCAKQTMDEAEEICPGMKRPVGDAADGKFTKSLLERVKRQAISGAGIKEFGDAATLEGAALDTAFKAVLMLKRSAKNPRSKSFGDGRVTSRPSNEDLNKMYDKFWKN